MPKGAQKEVAYAVSVPTVRGQSEGGTRAPTGIRNRALITVMYRGGLRLGEALQLKPKDLDAQKGTIRVLHGKGDKARLVGLDEGGWAIVQRWLDAIEEREPVRDTERSM